MTTRSRRTAANSAPSPEEFVSALEEGLEPPHQISLSEVADEAVRTGIVDPALPQRRAEIPGEDALLEAGDPDVDALENEFSGEQVPGGSTPSPDQNNVDDIGRAYGVTDADSGAMLSVEELLGRRDRRRWELDPRSKDPLP